MQVEPDEDGVFARLKPPLIVSSEAFAVHRAASGVRLIEVLCGFPHPRAMVLPLDMRPIILVLVESSAGITHIELEPGLFNSDVGHPSSSQEVIEISD